jgi:hypothetical protein
MKHSVIFRPFRAVYFSFCFRRPKASSYDSLKESDAIVAVPFGTHKKGETIGKSNNMMVNIMGNLHDSFPKQKLIVEWEMEYAKRKLDFDCIIGEKWSNHINTRVFFECIRKKYPILKNITVIAHPDHLLRVVKTARTLDFEPAIPHGLSLIPYDKTSTAHPWTQYRWKIRGLNPKKWGLMWWELLIARPFFVFKGWM